MADPKIDCQDYNHPLDTNAVEAFISMAQDVQAHRAAMVAAHGYSEAARERAKAAQIELYAIVDTGDHPWTRKSPYPFFKFWPNLLRRLYFPSKEYIDARVSGSLLDRCGRFPSDKALEIARRLCAGFATGHEKGVLHRDLKPANVMPDGRGRVLLTVFQR